MEKLTLANTQFALDMYHKLSESKPNENMFFAPLSITSALSMMYLGAKGDTANQMSKTLHIDAVEGLHSNFQTLTSDINKSGTSYTLNLANRLYGEKTYTFIPEFLASLKKLYGAELSTVDFLAHSGDARQQINEWVEEQTKGKILDLLAEGTVNSTTKLVLVNAIYFKGSWAQKFKEEDTVEMPFKITKSEQKPVQMMYQKKKFALRRIPEIQCRALELPYIENELSMIILLPDHINDSSTGLQKLEKELTLEKIQEWTLPCKIGRPRDVHVRLPKFKLEHSYELNDVLTHLGMVDIFDRSRANLSGMSGTRDLYLSKVVHKSFVEVNEEGTEAAAATAGIVAFCMVMEEEEFIADHPFLFFIRHNPTNSILFLGRYCSP
uniref:Leukocyte elastase inhibitor n=1 Tax=Geotrypetes seraphini TaxID=260995 RepID=A0A6P8Q685_GEOSA|nr:leukocyte elastase inhibitor [Geotrypetes seraphini]XP_033790793.1 leukocyte elastase inhibitor [Geotrypetes seraphini]XP_033790794.1 leukocyte elastase inhibitor [Geotrypetes seraphini]XP_033790795.1 leukocyte elastase inhibitor [Geotrypetes seraphini]XP_033790796.1 leukocyte elastase inhibitor [Geotrypetes seraphini]